MMVSFLQCLHACLLTCFAAAEPAMMHPHMQLQYTCVLHYTCVWHESRPAMLHLLQVDREERPDVDRVYVSPALSVSYSSCKPHQPQWMTVRFLMSAHAPITGCLLRAAACATCSHALQCKCIHIRLLLLKGVARSWFSGVSLLLQMTFVQALSGHGGWPMSVWLTPDLEPFTGGTYFPGGLGDWSLGGL
jgi:hypothetical protein